jgi:gliding motility-associated-like protein
MSKNYQIRLVAYSGNTCFAEKIKTITIIPTPKVKLDTVPNVCTNSPPIQLNGSEITGLKGNGMYSGVGVSLSGLFNPNTAGEGVHLLKYKFISEAGCTDSVSKKITVLKLPLINTLPDIIIPESEKITLKPNIIGNFIYSWYPTTGLQDYNTLTPTITGINDIVYTLTVSNGICESTQNLKITVLRKLEIYNTFSPNNDGVNDVWNIKNVNQYPNINVQIFNRYGIKLFQSNGYTSPWDGNYQNQPLPAGTYYYIISLESMKDKLSGFITLVR